MTSSMRYYETALQHDPDNLAAHHFLVHSYENTGEHATAAEHARIYATAAAGVPHAHHMYGHILPRLGNWQEALAQLTEADRLERAYYAALGIAPEEDWHHGHNLHLLGTVCLRLGNDKEAERLFQEAFNLQSRGPLADRYSAPWIEYLLLRGRFDEALKAALEVEKRATPLARVVGPALAGEALVARGRLNEAKRAQKRAEAAVQQAIDATAHSPYETFTPYFVQPFLDTLAGELALRRKDPSLGEMQYLAMADALVVNPRLDAWAEGLFRLERLAIDARRAGRPKLAQALVERMKKLDPDFTSSAVAAK
jgi:tetratricopeptide (TPR) repeat protein